MAQSGEEDDAVWARHPDRIWRVEQRQTDIIARLERLQSKLDENAQRRDAHEWRMENLASAITAKLDELLKRPAGGGGGMAGEFTPFVKMILMLLTGLVATLALGKAFWPL